MQAKRPHKRASKSVSLIIHVKKRKSNVNISEVNYVPDHHGSSSEDMSDSDDSDLLQAEEMASLAYNEPGDSASPRAACDGVTERDPVETIAPSDTELQVCWRLKECVLSSLSEFSNKVFFYMFRNKKRNVIFDNNYRAVDFLGFNTYN